METHESLPHRSVFIYPWETPLIQKVVLYDLERDDGDELYHLAISPEIGDFLLSGIIPVNVKIFFIPEDSYYHAEQSLVLDEFYCLWKHTIMEELQKLPVMVAVVTCSIQVAADLKVWFNPVIDNVAVTLFNPDINEFNWVPFRIKRLHDNPGYKLHFSPINEIFLPS